MAEPHSSESNVQIRIPFKYRFYISPSQARRTLAFCRNFLKQKDIFDLSVIYTNNKKIQIINKKFRKIDKPTDVLSFPMALVDPATGRKNLGDIFISVLKAKNQAREMNQSLKAELAILLIHGYLHLNGFDHDDEQKRKIMWSIQDQIFSAVMSSTKKLREK
jgi:probable rRNA maturation factor